MRISDWSSDVCSSDLDDRDDDDFFHRSGSLFLGLRGLQRGEFVGDLVGGLQLGDFLVERLLVAEAQRIGTAFGLVDAALEDFEAREGVFDTVAVGHLAQLVPRSEEHTSELQSLMRISYAVFCLEKTNN